MPRGGYREGAGNKPSWLHGKTKTIRVPEALSDKVLEIARALDEGNFESVTDSKTVDLSGIRLIYSSGRPAVLVEDLLERGFKVRPLALADLVRKQLDMEF